MSPERSASRGEQRGSALVMAIFMLALLTGMGTALLFLTETEGKMGAANLRGTQSFYLAEAGLEAGRAQLWDTNRAGEFDDDLVSAAGADGAMDFDASAITAVRDADGNVTGFTGFDDDVPVVTATAMGQGMYVVFLTNDPVEVAAGKPLVDDDDRVMLTGVGAGTDGSFEVVQAIIELHPVLPQIPPATITLLGPTPGFYGGTSKVKDYVGDDCGVGGGLFMPVVGVVGPGNVPSAEAGITANPDYSSGPWSDLAVFADLENVAEPTVTTPISPVWSDCASLQAMVESLRLVADYTCRGSCTIPHGPPGQIIVINGDISLGGSDSGYGTLLVTGELVANGNWDWDGIVFVIGEGQFRINGSGNGEISGAMLMADIAGPDNVYDTDDDCTGGTGGFSSASYDERGGGNSATEFCSTNIVFANPAEPYEIREFLQR